MSNGVKPKSEKVRQNNERNIKKEWTMESQAAMKQSATTDAAA